MIRLFLLERTDQIGYDETAGLVIAATSDAEAKQIANDRAGDEGAVWALPSTTCKRIGNAVGIKEPGVILVDFRAG